MQQRLYSVARKHTRPPRRHRSTTHVSMHARARMLRNTHVRACSRVQHVMYGMHCCTVPAPSKTKNSHFLFSFLFLGVSFRGEAREQATHALVCACLRMLVGVCGNVCKHTCADTCMQSVYGHAHAHVPVMPGNGTAMSAHRTLALTRACAGMHAHVGAYTCHFLRTCAEICA